MPNPVQGTRRQHYVPEFYLKRFAGDDGKLRRLDAERRKLAPSRMPRSVCHEDYFYALRTGMPDEVSQAFEASFSEFEDRFADQLPAVEAKLRSDKQLDAEGKAILSDLMSMLYLRGVGMRADIEHVASQVVKGTMRIVAGMHKSREYIRKHGSKNAGPPLSDDLVERTHASMRSGSFRVTIDNTSHLLFQQEMSGFAGLLEGQEWTVHVNESSLPFVTTCSPVAEYGPTDWKWAAIGPSFADCVHCFAVNSEVALIAKAPRNAGSATIVETLGPDQCDRVHHINCNLANRAPFVFARDNAPLKRLLANLGSSGHSV